MQIDVTDEMLDAAQAAVPDLYRLDAMRALEAALTLAVSRSLPIAYIDSDEAQPVYAALAAQPAANSSDTWISVKDRLPVVKEGQMERVIAAVRSAHNKKMYVCEAAYLNAMMLDDPTEDGERAFTGWHEMKEHADYDGFYSPVQGDVTHWMPLPPAPDVNQNQGEQDA